MDRARRENGFPAKCVNLFGISRTVFHRPEQHGMQVGTSLKFQASCGHSSQSLNGSTQEDGHMSHEIHSPGDEAAAPGGPLSNTLSLPRGCPLDCPRGRSPSATNHDPRQSPAPAAEVPGGPLSSPRGPASWSSGRWSAWRTPGPHPGCGRPGTAGRRDRAVTETSGPSLCGAFAP